VHVINECVLVERASQVAFGLYENLQIAAIEKRCGCLDY
jgi:hypothetical protein